MKLLKVDTVTGAKSKMDQYFSDLKLQKEELDLYECLGRIAAEDVFSPLNLPEFNRSTVDGYALKASDTFGASDSLPVFLELTGKVEMGQATDITVSLGEAVYVPTGGMIPQGADAMVMLEYVEQMDDTTIAVHRPSAPGENMITIGEDLKKGDLMLKKGRKIKPQDIGALAAVGITKIMVFEKPRIAVISTGDEIVEPAANVPFAKIRDINTYALASLATELGAIITYKGVVRDDFQELKEKLSSLINDNHIVVVSGGSSVGNKDVTARVIDSLGSPGTFVHGVAVKPGKPTIIGKAGNTALFGLPGHPVSAIIVFKIFIEYLFKKLNHQDNQDNYEQRVITVTAKAGANIHSAPGKETYQLVILQGEDADYVAVPIHGKSGAISLMTHAQGFIRIGHNTEGIKKGEKVQVNLL
ncbi:MAG: gephyrin-like molybdotransferase Glp [Bacillota bacterium]|jgi:molybdopterin molybdotransferase